MKIAVVGTGYVGLVSGVCLASREHDVTCVDINPAIVQKLNAGQPTIYEEGLPELLRQVQESGHFRATDDLNAALDRAEVVIVAVGTPSEKGVIELSYLRAAAGQIGAYLRGHDRHISVVIKSTVVPGTTDTVVREEIERISGKRLGAFGLGMNPEFLREGNAVEDFLDPDRIVLGHEDETTLKRLEEIYKSWNVDKLRTNCRTAEMIKYSNNFLLATQISAVNEIANLTASLGQVDVMEVMQGVHLDRRWNPIVNGRRVSPAILTYLVPGCGFGGSCFPKDVQALRSHGEKFGLPMRLMNAVLDINESQPNQVIETIKLEVGSLENLNVLVLGLAFKPGTDDVRESASLKIVGALVNAGASVTAHDPIASDNFKRALGPAVSQVTFVESWKSCIPAAEIVIVATRWPEYAPLNHMDLDGKVLFDARRMFKPQESGGAQYLTIGRRITS